MKILHILVNYHPSLGGTQIFYKGISENCVKFYNDEVEVFTVNSYYGPHSNQFKKIDIVEEVINGVKVKRFQFFRFHKALFKWINKIAFKLFKMQFLTLMQLRNGPWSPSLTKALACSDADVLSGSSNGYLFMNYPLYRNKLKNPKPFVYQGAIHFSENHNAQSIPLKTIDAIKASEFYMSNTQYEKDRLIKLGVPEDMIVITGSAIDMAIYLNGDREKYRQLLTIKEDEVLIGYIGRLEVTKSIDILIYAFEKAFKENRKLKLILAGFRYEYVNTLEEIIETLDQECQNNIKFLFDITQQDKIDLYHALDVYVLPSINESFGMVFLEAWSCKKPVIGTSIGAIRSVVDDGINGLLFKPNHVEDLFQKIKYLAENSSERNRLGSNGFQKTAENFTWEIVTEKYRKTYLQAIEKFNTKKELNKI